MTAEEIQDFAFQVFAGAEACDEHQTGLEWGDLKGRAIASFYEHGDYSESSGVAVFKLDDGRFCVIREWEDTTGHGCQCGGTTEFYASMDDVIKLGLSSEEVGQLGLTREAPTP